jgi:predicted XRE-type DNA-binding protein
MNQRSAKHHGVLTPYVLEFRSQVGGAIVQWIRQQGLTNVKVGSKMGLSASDVAALLDSGGQQFTLERLLRIGTDIGGKCQVLLRPPGGDNGPEGQVNAISR